VSWVLALVELTSAADLVNVAAGKIP
jgi:hypothetical protein